MNDEYFEITKELSEDLYRNTSYITYLDELGNPKADIFHISTAQNLYDKGWRKIKDNEIVITKSEYKWLKKICELYAKEK